MDTTCDGIILPVLPTGPVDDADPLAAVDAILEIGEGTSEVQRLVLARRLGLTGLTAAWASGSTTT